jgi:hypothetical protein
VCLGLGYHLVSLFALDIFARIKGFVHRSRIEIDFFLQCALVPNRLLDLGSPNYVT